MLDSYGDRGGNAVRKGSEGKRRDRDQGIARCDSQFGDEVEMQAAKARYRDISQNI